MDRLGAAGHNIAASLSYIAAQLCWAFAAGPGMINLSGLFFMLGGSSSLPTKTSLVTAILAARPGMQGGEIAGALANLTGVTKVIMPQVYARLFARYGQRGPFIFAALSIALGAAAYSVVSPDTKQKAAEPPQAHATKKD
jgi:Ca2+/Na+ antiporter